MATEIHRWEMEYGSTIVDQVGSADGTIAGTPGETIGILGTARYFDANEYVTCGNPSDIDFGTNEWTMRVIFRRPAIAASTARVVFAKYTDSSNSSFQLFTGASDYILKFNFTRSDGSVFTVSSPFQVVDGMFHDVVITRSGDTLYMYVDGVEVASLALSAGAAMRTSTADFRIGNQGGTSRELDGDVDHVQMWSGALTAEEISSLHYSPSTTISLGSTDPYDGETGISVSGLVSLEIADSANSVLLSTIEVSIDSVLAFDGDGGNWQTGYDGPASGLTVSGNGYYLTIDPTADFSYEDLIGVDVYAENDAGHILDTSYSFTIEQDTSAPVLENLNPVSGLTGVSRNTDIYLEIYDAEKTVDKTSITVYIDRDEGSGFELAYDDDGGGFQTGYSGSIAADPTDGANRYNLNIDPDDNFLDGRTVQVRVVADNTSSVADTLDEIYSFSTLADTDSPIVENADPPNAAANEPVDTSIYFEIYDSDVGVSTNSIVPWVDRDEGAGFEPVWNVNSGGWYPGWNGTIQEDPVEGINRFNITLVPDTDFTEGADISVRVTATDVSHPTPNPLDTTYSFGIAVYPSAASSSEGDDGVPVWGDLQISAYGGSGNMILDSIEIWLDSILVYDGDGGGFQSGYDGERSEVQFVVTGYDFTIDPTFDLEPETFYTLAISGINDLGFAL